MSISQMNRPTDPNLHSPGCGAMTGTPMSQLAICPETDGYEQFTGRWSRRRAPQPVRFAAVNEADAVLGVGCGTGALSGAAAAIPSTHVTGIDPSSELWGKE
jgi:2-polyprenyl-3-methyl-5-hydroxy-6-metoxy-1,4-benzoquinol methylase